MLKTDLCISVCDIFFDIPLDKRVKRRYNKAIMMVQNILLSSESLTHDHWVFRDISVVFSRLYYIIDGEAYYEEGGQRIRLKKNHLYLTPVKTPFTLWENPKDKLFHTYSHITTLPAIDRFIEVEVKEGTPLYDAVALWRRYIHTESSAYLSKVIELILACLDLEGEETISVAERVRRAIDNAGTLSFDFAALCRELGYSREHVTRSFHAAYHRTPCQYFNLKRMNVALRLLMDGATVGHVADELGFASPYAFSKAFKKYFGLSPEKYRTTLLAEPLCPNF